MKRIVKHIYNPVTKHYLAVYCLPKTKGVKAIWEKEV